MGVVYRARDQRLGREAALKFLSLSQPDEVALASFLHEARAISQLNHPNIATIYEVGEEDGEAFLALEYLPGGDLRTLIRAAYKTGELPWKKVVEYALQIARALGHAHSHGIVHRDIKPDNVLVTARGELKVIDFGVAQMRGAETDGPGAVTGTASYMSPEQAQGLDTDYRVDLFSYGVLLYELATGRLPFEGDSEPVVMYEVVNAPAPEVDSVRTDAPQGFSELVAQLLAKQPGDRPASMADVDHALVKIRKKLQMQDTAPVRPVQKGEPKVAVLPFVDMSLEHDQEYFCDGITEEILNALSLVKGLRVVSRSSAYQFKGGAYDVRDIGKRLGVGSVVEGSVRKAGARVRITVQLVQVSDGYHLWSQRFDRELSDVFAIQDEIAEAITENLRVQLVKGNEPAAAKPKVDVDAYNHYLQGRFFLNQRTSEALAKSRVCFEEAVRAEPSYAAAHAGLSEILFLQSMRTSDEEKRQVMTERAREAAALAVRLDDASVEAYVALAVVYYRIYRKWSEADELFRKALALNENHAAAHHQYAMLLSATQRFDEAVEHIRLAETLDPLSPIISTAVGRVLHFARQFDEAMAQFDKTKKGHPGFAGVYFDRAITHGYCGRMEAARDEMEIFGQLTDDPIRVVVMKAWIDAKMGKRVEALAGLEQVQKDGLMAGIRTVLPEGLIYLGLEDYDAAMDCLIRAANYGEDVSFLLAEPAMAGAKDHERYAELLGVMNLGNFVGRVTK